MVMQLRKESETALPTERESDSIGSHSEVWLLLHQAIRNSIYSQARGQGVVSAEDLEDLASQKSLDLLLRIVDGRWDLRGHSPEEIRGFISMAARNGIIDLLRRFGRMVPLEGEVRGGEPRDMRDTRTLSPEEVTFGRDFVRALTGCLGTLPERSREVWFFRVFLELSSEEIAAHPRVQIRASHVDVLLHRARQAISRCMEQKGHRSGILPAGTFTELWKFYHPELMDQGSRTYE
jgi:RNA polymerase sigma factor (sigma-70 family)